MSDEITREEQLYNDIIASESASVTPITRKETFLAAIANGEKNVGLEPITREERYLAQIAENGSGGGYELSYTTAKYNVGDTMSAEDAEALIATTDDVYKLIMIHFTGDISDFEAPVYQGLTGAGTTSTFRASNGGTTSAYTGIIITLTYATRALTNISARRRTGPQASVSFTPKDFYFKIFKVL